MKHILLLLFLVVGLHVAAQEDWSWQQAFRQLSDVEDVESATWEETFEMLENLSDQPLDINNASREQLEALPFLTAQQVEDIMGYRYRHGELQTLGELLMIPSLDYQRRRLLQCFTYVGHQPARQSLPRIDSLLRWGKHEVTFSAHIPFYQRKGDRNGYLGYPYKHTLRYQFHYGSRVKFGLLGAQDAGEPFFAEGNSLGYDHYAWYLLFNRLGPVETLALGQYRLSFGMGLVMNGGFSFGKLATLQNLGRSSNQIRANSSRIVDGYLQGAAITIGLFPSTLNLHLTAYGSYRPLDATINNDGTAATLLTDGYHRTPAEMQKKHNLTETDAGLHLEWRRGALRLGATAAYTHLSRELRPNTTAIYRRYYPAGSDFLNASLDYRYTSHRLSFSGETAIDGNGALATANALSYQPSGVFSIMALQRFYSYRYAGLHARSFAEGSRTQNESGLYLGVSWKPVRQLQLNAYTDYAWFAFPKYQVSQSSYAWDNMLSATYNAPRWSFQARYRLHIRQRDTADKKVLLNRTEHRARLAFTCKTLSDVTLQTQADFAYTDYNERDLGYMLSERLGYTLHGVKLDAGVGYFHTDSYEARLYLYERAPRYQFTFPMFYGEGIRYWFMAQGTIASRLVLTAKWGVTNYFDRATIGTDKQLIDHSSMSDLDVQLTYKF